MISRNNLALSKSSQKRVQVFLRAHKITRKGPREVLRSFENRVDLFSFAWHLQVFTVISNLLFLYNNPFITKVVANHMFFSTLLDYIGVMFTVKWKDWYE